MFELLEMTLCQKKSKVVAIFDFIYEGLTVKNAMLYLNEDKMLQIDMPKMRGRNNKLEEICYFEGDSEKILEPLKLLVLQKYYQLIESQ